jgi:O-acetyl-ADP-ribose deacetylase (regulator of RNase III)
VNQLTLDQYSSKINLFEKFTPAVDKMIHPMKTVDKLLDIIINENGELNKNELPEAYEDKRSYLDAYLTVRKPGELSHDFIVNINTLLQFESQQKGIVNVDNINVISNKIALWPGDITSLDADAIVNTANNQLSGCTAPFHKCIDNLIHSAAGPQLRNDCDKIISIQGELEKTGGAKITRAYNLPSKYVLHTVGPVIEQGTLLTKEYESLLASCYTSCLELAKETNDIKTIAFSPISTGEYGFPTQKAAEITINAVADWLANNPNSFEKIILNVFTKDEYTTYQNVLDQEL